MTDNEVICFGANLSLEQYVKDLADAVRYVTRNT